MNYDQSKGPFNVKFSIFDYRDILPDIEEYLKDDYIINQEHRNSGNVDAQIWKRYRPAEGETDSVQFRKREVKRILKTGAWIWIKDYPVWLPPNYYHALQYGVADDVDVQFRLKRLKHVYFKIRARNNPGCMGTFTVKNRGDGETTMSILDAFWELCDGNINVGQVGLQSKTREDAANPCWQYATTIWQSYAQWVKDELYSDFSSGDNIAEKMRFQRSSDEYHHARNVLFKYYPAVYNAMDGKHNIKKCILDEVLKWIECDFGTTFTNYKKFIMPGFERRGMFDMFSTPPEKDCASYRQGYELYHNSLKINDNGTTDSRIHGYYSNPLDGIAGSYDRWGDVDPQMIYDHIMRERKAVPKDLLMGEIRAFPLSDEEIWGSLEAGSIWSNTEGIKQRKIYLIGTRYKDRKTLEPKVVYGNLERVDGYIDGEVEFRQADVDHFDLKTARFCFSYLPLDKEPLKSIFTPPPYVENALGVDPFNHRYGTKDDRGSDMAMVNRRFRDVFSTSVKKCPTMIYCCRPTHQEIAFEDCLKAAVFNRAMIQYENKNDKLANYAEDRGYSEWLLPSIGEPAGSVRKGDAPSGRGRFLEEGIGLIDAATNIPIDPEGDYPLERYWFIELLTDYLAFNPKDTQKNNLTMADMQALIGIVKILHIKRRVHSDLNAAVMNYLFE